MWLLTQQNYIITQFQTKEVRLLTCLLQLLRAYGTENRHGKQLQLIQS